MARSAALVEDIATLEAALGDYELRAAEGDDQAAAKAEPLRERLRALKEAGEAARRVAAATIRRAAQQAQADDRRRREKKHAAYVKADSAFRDAAAKLEASAPAFMRDLIGAVSAGRVASSACHHASGRAPASYGLPGLGYWLARQLINGGVDPGITGYNPLLRPAFGDAPTLRAMLPSPPPAELPADSKE
jgi:hypothetical protein